jgi:monosaccharide ABC transporter substrate-binding protein, CUT2 family (TC 3.A.1.2.-)
VPLHNAWADAAIAYQKKKYPEMKLVADRFGVAESLDETYRTTQDLMRANADLGGIVRLSVARARSVPARPFSMPRRPPRSQSSGRSPRAGRQADQGRRDS